MHNKHILRITTVSHGDAQGEAETIIEDWGAENNWREILGSVCKDGTFDFEDESTNKTLTGDTIIKNLTNAVQQDITGSIQRVQLGPLFIQVGLQISQGIPDFEIAKSLPSVELYGMKHAIEEIKVRGYTTDNFDIWEDEYREWQLDEFGVTQLGIHDADLKGSENHYLVLIDMHS